MTQMVDCCLAGFHLHIFTGTLILFFVSVRFCLPFSRESFFLVGPLLLRLHSCAFPLQLLYLYPCGLHSTHLHHLFQMYFPIAPLSFNAWCGSHVTVLSSIRWSFKLPNLQDLICIIFIELHSLSPITSKNVYLSYMTFVLVQSTHQTSALL